jgi:hypothetical protein
MKKIFVLLLVLSSLASHGQKHYVASDFFTQQSIVWYGIDYSKAKFIGSFAQFKDAGAVDGKKLVDDYFPGWNLVIIREPEKYNIAKFFNKETSSNDIDAITKINSKTNPDGIMQEDDYTLDEKVIPDMVKKYESKNKEGLGVVLIAERYNHTKESGSYYVVIFDIASKRVLISQKYSAEPRGFGIKSYWISTARKTLENVADDYGKWKKTYGK